MKLGRSCGKGGSRSSVSYLSATGTCLKSERGFCTKVWCSPKGPGGSWSLSTALVEIVSLLSFPKITKMSAVQPSPSHNMPLQCPLKLAPTQIPPVVFPLGTGVHAFMGGGIGTPRYLFKEFKWVGEWNASLASFPSETKFFTILWETKSWSKRSWFPASSIWKLPLGSQGSYVQGHGSRSMSCGLQEGRYLR